MPICHNLFDKIISYLNSQEKAELEIILKKSLSFHKCKDKYDPVGVKKIYDKNLNFKFFQKNCTVDLSFYESYRYQTLASFFKAFELFIHRSKINFGRPL